MGLVEIIILSIVQGLTEFLPISSSGHLVLIAEGFKFDTSSLSIDVFLHTATLFAVILYLKKLPYSQIIPLIIATIPIVIIGFFAIDYVDVLRQTNIVGISLLVSAFFILIVDMLAQRQTLIKTNKFVKALIIGLFQVVAIIPGVSRSGITIAAGRLVGESRKEASLFSFLISVPVIAAATILSLKDLPATLEVVGINYLAIGFILCFVIAFLTIKYFIRFVEQIGLWAFAAYQIIMGVLVLLFL